MNQEASKLESWDQPKEEISVADMDDAVKALRDAKDEYDVVKKKSSEAYAIVKEREGKLVSLLHAAGKNKYIVEGIGSVTVSETLSIQTPKTPEQKEAFFTWLKDEMGEDGFYTYATVNSNSLNSLYKKKAEEYALRGEVLTIDGLNEPTSFSKLSIRKA